MTIILNKAVSTYGVLMVFSLSDIATSCKMVETRLSMGVDGRNPETLKWGKSVVIQCVGEGYSIEYRK